MRRIGICVLLFIVIIFPGCSKFRYNMQDISAAEQNQWIPVTIYCRDREGNVVPTTVKFGKRDNALKTAADSLVYSVFNEINTGIQGLYSSLPKGTEILGVKLSIDTATIDFNRNLLNYADATSEKCIVGSIVYTMTELSDVKNVIITVNGQNPKILRYGTNLSHELNRKNVLLNARRINLKSGMSKVDVYLAKNIDSASIYLVPVSIEFKGIDESQVPGKIIELLVMDYSAKKLYTHLPLKTKLLNSSLKDGVLLLNLSNDFLSYDGGTARETTIINQIIYSMRTLDGVEKVRIVVNGKTTTLTQGTEISDDMYIPEFINFLSGIYR